MNSGLKMLGGGIIGPGNHFVLCAKRNAQNESRTRGFISFCAPPKGAHTKRNETQTRVPRAANCQLRHRWHRDGPPADAVMTVRERAFESRHWRDCRPWPPVAIFAHCEQLATQRTFRVCARTPIPPVCVRRDTPREGVRACAHTNGCARTRSLHAPDLRRNSDERSRPRG